MAGGHVKLPRRKPSPSWSNRGEEIGDPKTTELWMQGADERRSKMKEDMRSLKGKASTVSGAAPSKKRKSVTMQVDSSSKDERGLPDMEDSEKDVDADSDTSGTQVEDEYSSNDKDCSPPAARKGKRIEEDKKTIKLDVLGFSNGRMMPVMAEDIKRYVKDLDLTCSWEAQPSQQKKRFFKRLYNDWEMKGGSSKVSDKWISPIVTKILINTRWRLNGMIDAEKAKPAEVTTEHWDTLVRNRQSPASRKLSEHMRAISVGKGSKLAQLRVIESDAINSLSIRLGRKPKPKEVSAEVVREYNRQEEAKRASVADRARDLDDMNTRVVDIEGALTGLQRQIESSQGRFEDMLQEIMGSGGGSVQGLGKQAQTLPLQPTSLAPGPSTTVPALPISTSVDALCLPHSSEQEVVENSDVVVHADGPVSNEVEMEGNDREDVVKLYMQDIPVNVVGGNVEEHNIPMKAALPAVVGHDTLNNDNDDVVTEDSAGKDVGDALADEDGNCLQKADHQSSTDGGRRPPRPQKSMQTNVVSKKIVSSKSTKGSNDKSLGAVKPALPTAKVMPARRAEANRKK